MNVKKLSLAILIIAFIVSCNSKDSSSIVGTWKNTSVKIDKLDQISEFVYTTQLAQLEAYENDYQSILDTMTDGQEKEGYQNIVAEIQANRNNLTVDTIKNGLIDQMKLESFNFIDDSSSSMVLKLNEIDSIMGNWKLITDDTSKRIDIEVNGQPVSFNVIDMTSDKLTLERDETIDTIHFKITFNFDKLK